MDSEKLKQRTRVFALRIIKLIEALPKSTAGHAIANQLVRCGTSVGANYHSACRGRSKAEFLAKLGIVIEEADESQYWLLLVIDSGMLTEKQVTPLLQEARELTAIFTASAKTARKRNI